MGSTSLKRSLCVAKSEEFGGVRDPVSLESDGLEGNPRRELRELSADLIGSASKARGLFETYPLKINIQNWNFNNYIFLKRQLLKGGH